MKKRMILFTTKILNTDNKKALAAYRKLRNFYRRNYEHGDYDTSFHTWIEIMIDRDRATRNEPPIYSEDE